MTFTYNGVSMNYTLSGEGPYALLLHGWGGSTQSWLPVERALTENKTVINVDFPGFGASSEPPAPWSVTEYRDITLALLDSLGVTETEIIAHSFGGRVALMINEARPALVRKQVLTGCAGLINPADKTGNGLAGKLKKLYDNGLTRSVLGDKTVDKIQNAVRSRFGSADYRAASPNMRETFKKVVDQDLEYCLSQITAPTLLIWGENDTATPLWMGKRMEQTIPDAGLVVFEGSGHFAYLEQCPRFITVIKSFL